MYFSTMLTQIVIRQSRYNKIMLFHPYIWNNKRKNLTIIPIKNRQHLKILKLFGTLYLFSQIFTLIWQPNLIVSNLESVSYTFLTILGWIYSWDPKLLNDRMKLQLINYILGKKTATK